MTTFHVEYPPLTLVLAQAVPGRDGEVAQDMANHYAGGDERQPDIRNYIYFAFSEYDVLAIVPLDEEGHLDRLTTFGHEHVRDLQQVMCFPWVVGGVRPGDFQPGPALTLTFFKLDEGLLVKEGIEAEYDAVRWLQQRIRSLREQKEYRSIALDGLVLGTLGWPELVLILTGNDLSLLLHIIRDLGVAPIKRPRKPDLEFAFSHTLPCVRWDGNPERFSAEPVNGQVCCQVMVSARPNHLGHVVQQVENLRSGPAQLPGTHASESAVPPLDAAVVLGRRALPCPRRPRGRVAAALE